VGEWCDRSGLVVRPSDNEVFSDNDAYNDKSLDGKRTILEPKKLHRR